jgi:uncharacterized protein YjdB
MQNERMEVTSGPAEIRAGRLTLCVCLLAGALIACGKSHSNGSPGGPGSPTITLQSVALTPPSLTIPTGAQQQFALIGSYSDGTTATITSGISWSSSNPSVASLGGAGLLTATTDSTAAGTTMITASVGALSAQASVTVTPATLLSISVEPPTASIAIPVIMSFTAIGHYSDGTSAPLVNVTWSSSDPTVASVDGAGFAQGVKQGGPVTITALHTASGKSNTASLTINAPVLLSISVSPAVASIPAGFSRQFTAIGQLSDGSSTPVTASWSISGVAATVDANGLALGVTAGGAPVTITATASGFSSTASLTVTTPAAATVASSHFDAAIDPINPANYQVSGLTPGAEYLVRLTSAAPIDLTTLQVEVDQDASFTARVCSSWAKGPPCRAGTADSSGNLFVLVTGPVGALFTLDTSPLPIILAGDPAILDSVNNTETYYKVVGLTAPTFTPTLGSSPGAPLPLDIAADLFAYDGPQGPFGSALLGSTVPATTVPKSFVGSSPLTQQAYLTVEGWLTSAGTDFSLAVASP